MTTTTTEPKKKENSTRPKHTEGPYKVVPFSREDGSGYAITDQDENVLGWVYEASPNAFGKMTASTLPAYHNAHVLAGAPDLLEALVVAQPFVQKYGLEVTKERVNAAINNAQGVSL